MTFPAPVGGVPFKEDFVPSVVYAGVYAGLVLLGIFRLARKSTRTLVILSPLSFCLERIVVWSLRAKQAKTPSEDFDKTLTVYWQITFAAAYMTVWACLVNLLRCVLVATTRGNSPVQHTAPLMYRKDDGSEPAPYDSENYSYSSDYALPMETDRPDLRLKYRRALGVLSLAAWVPVVIGMLMGYNYVNAETDHDKANTVQSLRSISAVVALLLIIVLQLWSTFALFSAHGIKRSAVLLLLLLGGILMILPIYELVVIRNWTTSLTSTAPGSQNTHGEKLAFYVLRAAPEALVSGILLGLDVRNIFGTGIKGDPFNDPKDQTPYETQPFAAPQGSYAAQGSSYAARGSYAPSAPYIE